MTNLYSAVTHNVVLMTALCAWTISQILKTFTAYWKHSHFNAERLIGAGGMPSSHTTLVVSLASAVGYKDGFDSVAFAITVVLAGIVMHDAAGVRRASGKQAKVINKLVREMRFEHKLNESSLKELLGHTPREVLAGALLGVLIAYLFHRFY